MLSRTSGPLKSIVEDLKDKVSTVLCLSVFMCSLECEDTVGQEKRFRLKGARVRKYLLPLVLLREMRAMSLRLRYLSLGGHLYCF